MVPLHSEMIFVEPVFCRQAVLNWCACGSREKKKELMESGNVKSGEMSLQAKKHLSAVGWKFSYAEKKGKIPKKSELRYLSPKGRYFHSLRTACIECMKDPEFFSKDITARSEIPIQSMVRQDGLEGAVLENRKKRRNPPDQDVDIRKPRSILSLLIDNNAVMPNAKVYYTGRKGDRRMKGGWITRDGINCDCCQKLFNLSGFEVHAGSTYRRPAASIVLEDGRSLLECQTHILNKCEILRPNTHKRVRGGQPHYKSDFICSICHYGGELLLCDGCPSVFHLSCVGLMDLPEGNWFCPSCRCGLCGQNEFHGNLMDLHCDQCGRGYHFGCLRESGLVKLEDHPKGKWFCTKKCESIFISLHEILGKSFPVGDTNLSWVILQSSKDGRGDPKESSGAELRTDYYRKLNAAVGLMHECFEPIGELNTNGDLVEDLIFSKWSERNHRNFQGFYTVLLQQRDELICVATVRIHNEKVAEVPLIGTRLQYRRKGMCHLLMNEIEKKLIEFGVERLVLPAAAKVLNMWTTYFRFSKMTDSERLNDIGYTFLNFQDTIMCQKLLTKISSSNQCYECVDIDKCRVDSEVTQDDQIEKSEIVEQFQQEDQIEQSEIVEQLQEEEILNERMECLQPDQINEELLNERMECLQPDQIDEEFWRDFLSPDVFNEDLLYYPSSNQNDR
ncbi:hypothetical protein NE237_019597 [Protea cynaroides]|uniref:PHD-type domain-containing protein n=1 Tax=Protea cynaroides TaxID=273540 RepID=A0A9Q0K1U5_9MAGN|nr:hypothetical protein NE237_019597 [Protea cynaroides]